MTATCGWCGKPSPHSRLCEACTGSLYGSLSTIASLAGELDAAMARQIGRGYSQGVGRSADKPLPVDLRITPVKMGAYSTLSSFAYSTWPNDWDTGAHLAVWDLGGLAVYAMRHVGDLARRVDAESVLAHIQDRAREMRRVLEVSRDTWYAGTCLDEASGVPCPAELYVDTGRATVTCPACKAEHDVASRREFLRSAVGDHLGTASEISRLCRTQLGDLVTPAMIRGYAHRGHIQQHSTARSTDVKGRSVVLPRYRVGDVLVAAARAAASPQAKREAQGTVRAMRKAEQAAGGTA